MNIIIPMAGRGSRLRPHTLTTPKPLIPIAGIPIVERLVEDIVRTLPVAVKKIAFVTGRVGEECEKDLLDDQLHRDHRRTDHRHTYQM